MSYICPICGKEAIPNDLTMTIDCSDSNCHTTMTAPYAIMYARGDNYDGI